MRSKQQFCIRNLKIFFSYFVPWSVELIRIRIRFTPLRWREGSLRVWLSQFIVVFTLKFLSLRSSSSWKLLIVQAKSFRVDGQSTKRIHKFALILNYLRYQCILIQLIARQIASKNMKNYFRLLNELKCSSTHQVSWFALNRNRLKYSILVADNCVAPHKDDPVITNEM